MAALGRVTLTETSPWFGVSGTRQPVLVVGLLLLLLLWLLWLLLHWLLMLLLLLLHWLMLHWLLLLVVVVVWCGKKRVRVVSRARHAASLWALSSFAGFFLLLLLLRCAWKRPRQLLESVSCAWKLQLPLRLLWFSTLLFSLMLLLLSALAAQQRAAAVAWAAAVAQQLALTAGAAKARRRPGQTRCRTLVSRGWQQWRTCFPAGASPAFAASCAFRE